MRSSLTRCSIIIDKICSNLPPHLYCCYYNVVSSFRRWGSRLSYNRNPHFFRLTSTEYRDVYFANKTDAIGSFNRGVKGRIRQMTQAYMLDHVEFGENPLIIDCGSNCGDFQLAINELVGDVYCYYAFEPSPSDYIILQMNLGLYENIYLDSRALFDKSGSLDFFLSTDGADSSLIKPAEYTSTITVDTIRLDDYTPLHDRIIDLFKLEAEGAEPEIIVGAERILPKIRYITADLGPERGVSAENTVAQVVTLLTSKGFKLIMFNSNRTSALFKNTNL